MLDTEEEPGTCSFKYHLHQTPAIQPHILSMFRYLKCLYICMNMDEIMFLVSFKSTLCGLAGRFGSRCVCVCVPTVGSGTRLPSVWFSTLRRLLAADASVKPFTAVSYVSPYKYSRPSRLSLITFSPSQHHLLIVSVAIAALTKRTNTKAKKQNARK